MNALAREKSPYLRQHQSNPVDWLPWGEEAFARARAEGKPVLLSVGYAACHWCHVMARESFDDAATAAMMNARFVNVKVDREERPDVDAIYVRALQAMGKRAGWPLTMFLTPDAKPFWGGTYFAPERRGQQPSFREVLEAIGDAYRSDPATAEARATSLIESLADSRHDARAELPSGTATAAAEELLRGMDPVNGGMKGAPKFPYPALVRFLWNEGRDSTTTNARGETRMLKSSTLLCFMLGAVSAAALAQYPERPVRVIVPFAPGGNVDVTARTIAPALSEILGRQLVLDNRSGAGGAVGAELVATANPDGYTLLVGSTGLLTIAPVIFDKLRYDPIADFAPISLISKVPLVMVVNPKLPANTAKDFVALAKSRGGDMTMGKTVIRTAGLKTEHR